MQSALSCKLLVSIYNIVFKLCIQLLSNNVFNIVCIFDNNDILKRKRIFKKNNKNTYRR